MSDETSYSYAKAGVSIAAGTALVIDARLAALAVAALALWLRLPFLLVVLLGAAAAGLVRWWG